MGMSPLIETSRRSNYSYLRLYDKHWKSQPFRVPVSYSIACIDQVPDRRDSLIGINWQRALKKTMRTYRTLSKVIPQSDVLAGGG